MNDGYVPQVAASALSLIDHNPGKHTFHVFSFGISEENVEKLHHMIVEKGCDFQVYEVGDIERRLEFEVDTLGFHISVLARLFVGRILPETVERVLYLDGDTIVLEPLDELWNMELNLPLAMSIEPVTHRRHLKELGMPEDAFYCNSGVILFNLKLWREKQCEKRVLEYYRERSKELIAPDQDALNGALTGEIAALEPRYNFCTNFINYPYATLKKLMRPADYIPEETFEKSKRAPAIIHYLGEERPWREGNKHPYRDEFRKYLSDTPWGDRPEDQGWKGYFFCFYLFNFLIKPLPMLRWKIIDSLIPAFMRYRKKQLMKKETK